MRYREMHRALQARFGVRYVEYVFPEQRAGLGHGEPEAADEGAGGIAEPRCNSCQEPPGRL